LEDLELCRFVFGLSYRRECRGRIQINLIYGEAAEYVSVQANVPSSSGVAALSLQRGFRERIFIADYLHPKRIEPRILDFGGDSGYIQIGHIEIIIRDLL